jgi:hypothetical protein
MHQADFTIGGLMKNKRNRRISGGKGRITAIDALEPRYFLSTVKAAAVPAAAPTPASTLIATLPFAATDFVESADGATIYATVPTLGEVVVINESQASVIDTIQVGTKPTGLALSADGSTLYVADNGSTNIDIINTATNSVGTPLSLGGGNFPTDVQVGNNNRLWVLVGGTVMQIDQTTGASTGPSFNTQSGDIRVTPDGTTLVAAQFGSSPDSVDGWNVSATTAVKLYTTNVGANGKDLDMSADGSTFVVPCGGGNPGTGNGYFDDTFATIDGTAHSNVMVGAFPWAFAFSKDGTLGYAGEDFQSPSIQAFNLTADMSGVLTFGSANGTITTANDPQKMFAATNGDLYVGEGSVTEIFGVATKTSKTAPTVTGVSPNQGPSTGGTVVTITGTNLTNATEVQFGLLDAVDFVVDSDTQITAVTPAGTAGVVDVTVTSAGGTSRNSFNDKFTYIAETNSAPTAPLRSITVTPPHTQDASAGTIRSFSLGSFTESGAAGPYVVTVNWGDQTANTAFTTSVLGTIPVKSHVYTSVGTDTVSITITGSTGIKSNTATFKVKVSEAISPWIVVLPPVKQSAFPGVPKTFSLGSFIQSQGTSPFTVNVNWGDGSGDTVFSMPAAGAITPQRHTYASLGSDSPTITVTDATGVVTYTSSFGVSVVTQPTVSASLSAAPLTTEQNSYSFSVTYTGSVDIYTPSLDNHNIFVTGPNGYLQTARLVSFTASKSGKSVTAIYRIKPPGSTWLKANDGTYHVYIRGGQVEDHDHDFVAAAVLGPFKVKI